MARFREDLSEWALHFIHDHNPDTDPTDNEIDYEFYGGLPYHESKEVNDRFDAWRISDEFYPIDPDSDALQVLLKIIADGHIRASWAFRNNRPTIYGPRAAVCFTEMPLYALLDYASQREKHAVAPYAIGLYKQELFRAGARPVIYGLTGKHAEQRDGSVSSRSWPRKLTLSCGLAESEQYRYVAMSSDPMRAINWSHEREWRWADHQDRCSCPGVPIWLSDEPTWFTRVFIVVPNSVAMDRVLNRLKELHDAGANDADHAFSRKMLRSTAVVALDRLEQGIGDKPINQLRLDDISPSYMQVFERPPASRELLKKASNVLKEARISADQAGATHYESAPRTKDGHHIADVAGWAHLVIHDGQTPLISALLELNEIYSVPGEGYYFRNVGGLGWKDHQALSLAEAAVRAAMEVFEKHFPETSFSMTTRWD